MERMRTNETQSGKNSIEFEMKEIVNAINH